MILQNFTLITCSNWSNNIFTSNVISTYGMIDITAKELTDVFSKKTSNKDFKLEDLKKVLFAEKCEFPRFKLSNFTNIKRALKPSTADAIIFTQETVYEHYENNLLCCFSESFQMYYVIDCNSIKNAFRRTNIDYNGLSEKDRIEKIIDVVKIHNVLPEDSKFVNYRIFTKIYDYQIKNYKLLTSGKLVITSEDLNNKLTGTLDKVDDDVLKSIDELLGSSDPGSVGMGMDLLINFNVLERSCTIGMLLLKHGEKIYNNRKCSSVGFKNIMSSLGINKLDLCGVSDEKFLRYINNLYKICKNEDDKLSSREIARQIINNKVNKEAEYYNKYCHDLNFKIKIEVL